VDFCLDVYLLGLSGTVRKRREILKFVLYHFVSRLCDVTGVPESAVYFYYSGEDGFGSLVVRMLASGSRVRGFKPGRSRWIFLYIKILSMPSFGGEVKQSVPCPNSAACNRTSHLQ
jgi:hypothetical protein